MDDDIFKAMQGVLAEDDLLKGVRRLRPQGEIGLEDALGGPGGPALPGVFSGKVRPANQNEELFTPEQPSRQGVSYFLTPEQKQRLADMGFQPWHIANTSPEQARDIIAQHDAPPPVWWNDWMRGK
jgi:hypothetical protein